MFGACWVASHQCECLGNFSWNFGVLCSFIPCTALAVCEQPRVPVAMKRWAAWAGAGEFPVPQVVLVRRGGRAGPVGLPRAAEGLHPQRGAGDQRGCWAVALAWAQVQCWHCTQALLQLAEALPELLLNEQGCVMLAASPGWCGAQGAADLPAYR